MTEAMVKVYTFQSLVNGLDLETFQEFKAKAYAQLQMVADELETILPSNENATQLREVANKIDSLSSNVTLLWVLADAYLDLAISQYRVTKEQEPKMSEEDRKVRTDALVVEYRTIRNMCERLAERLKGKTILATKNMSLLETEIKAGLTGKMRDDTY